MALGKLSKAQMPKIAAYEVKKSQADLIRFLRLNTSAEIQFKMKQCY